MAGVGLGVVSKIFAVEIDPKEEGIADLLPGANCGACGFAGCRGLAAAIAAGTADVKGCPVCGDKEMAEIASILGVELIEDPLGPKIARVLCGGGCDKAVDKFEYSGVADCTAAVIVSGGAKSCVYGCIGLGTCEKVCPFDAIIMNDRDLPVVDPDKCTGCMICVTACPKEVIGMVPKAASVIFNCHSKDKGKAVKGVCSVGCISCGACERVCPFNAVKVTDGYVENDFSKCVHCGLCVLNCPTKTIVNDGKAMGAYINEACTGCSMCKKVCPVNAISGTLKQMHTVDADICIGCGLCDIACPKDAVDMEPLS